MSGHNNKYPCLSETLGTNWLARHDKHPLRRYLSDSSHSAVAIASNLEMIATSLKSHLDAPAWKLLGSKLKSRATFQSTLSEMFLGNHLIKAGLRLRYETSNKSTQPDWFTILDSGERVFIEVHCPAYPTLKDGVIERLEHFVRERRLTGIRIEFHGTEKADDLDGLSAQAYSIIQQFKKAWESNEPVGSEFSCEGPDWSIDVTRRNGRGYRIVALGSGDVKPPELFLPRWIQKILNMKGKQIQEDANAIVAVDVSLAHAVFSDVKVPYVLDACKQKVKMPLNIHSLVLFSRNIDEPEIRSEVIMQGRDESGQNILKRLNLLPT
jgi:hypothetical protein